MRKMTRHLRVHTKNNPHDKIDKSSIRHADAALVLAVIGLILFGLIAVFNSSVVIAFRDFGDKFYFIRSQLIYLFGGLVLASFFSFIDYHRWYKLSIPILVATLLLLVGVFIPGLGVHALGAKRWINLGFFSLQPTELAKLSLVIYLSAWFSFKERGRFIPFLTLMGILLGLIILQPDMGTAIIILSIAVILYFLSGAPLYHFLYFIPPVLIALGGLAIVAPYRLARITTFLNPDSDPLGTSYHIHQILLGLGSGGMFGLGLGKSRQKYAYLPEANTDSIFAIIGEELGFVGAFLLILLFIFIIYRAFKIARHAPDKFGSLLASGIGSWFAIQTVINLGAMVALIPLTGVPLPFVSYGGSNLVTILIGFGILLNISRSHRKHIE